MGRILSAGSNGASVSGGGAIQNLSTVVIAGEAVVQGQLASVGVDGLAYYVLDPAGPGGALRPVSGIPAPTSPCPTGPGLAIPGTIGPNGTACVLTNGNAVIVAGNNGSFVFGVYNSVGVQLGGLGTVPHAAPNMNVYAVPLSAGGFAVAYQDQGTMQPMVAIFSNSGAPVLAPVSVEAGVGTSALALAPLSNGGFAVAYCTTAGTVRYAVYSATGTLLMAPTGAGLTGVLTSTTCAISVCALTAGGFVIAGMIGANQTSFSRFNATGAAQQSNVAAYIAAGVSNSTGTVCAVGLSGGGFIIVQQYTGGPGSYVSTFSALGVAVGSTYSSGSNAASYYPGCAAIARPDGSAVVIAASNIFIANSNGAIGAQASTNVSYGNALAQADNGWIVAAGYGTTLEVRDASLNLISSLSTTNLGLLPGQLNSSPISLLPVARSVVKQTAPLVMVMTPGLPSARYTSIALTAATGQKTTPIGVFAASAAAGSAVPVQYQGVATLSTGFVQPFTMDANSAYPPGQRMAIVGNQATLSGIQPPQNRRQIN